MLEMIVVILVKILLQKNDSLQNFKPYSYLERDMCT